MLLALQGVSVCEGDARLFAIALECATVESRDVSSQSARFWSIVSLRISLLCARCSVLRASMNKFSFAWALSTCAK